MQDIEKTLTLFGCIKLFCGADEIRSAVEMESLEEGGRDFVRACVPSASAATIENRGIARVDRDQKLLRSGRLPDSVAEEEDRSVPTFAIHIIFHPEKTENPEGDNAQDHEN
jgi:hypothetical protein